MASRPRRVPQPVLEAGCPEASVLTGGELDLPAAEYFHMYAVPNFFFHYSMVYAIARQGGVPVGKSDFDGYHRYPSGFTFEER